MAFISLRQQYPGEAKKIIAATFGATTRVKLVVVVDEDIDVYDYGNVLWAILTRAQPHEDITITPGMAGMGLDPTESAGVTSVVGIDATRPWGVPFPEMVKIPGLENVPDL